MEGKAKVSLLDYQAKQPATRDLFKHLPQGRQVDRARRRVDQVPRPQGQADGRLRLAEVHRPGAGVRHASSATATTSRCCSSRRRGAAAVCTATSARRAPGCPPARCWRRCSPSRQKRKPEATLDDVKKPFGASYRDDARRGERHARGPEEALPRLRRPGLRAGRASSGSRAGTT